MSETDEKSSNKFKVGISLWLSICVFVCLWFLSRFMTGRRQLRNNLHVIEDGLRRMQEDIEQRQREQSIGYGENLEELAEELFKKEFATKKKEEEMGEEVHSMDKQKNELESSEEVCVGDKKND